MRPSVPPSAAPRLQDARRKITGTLGEQAAAAHLERRGLEILERGFRKPAGEIDLIAAGPGLVVFAEVKTTRCARPEPAGEALRAALERVRAGQRGRIRTVAAAWLRTHPANSREPRELRFDAIAVVLDVHGRLAALEHVEDAF